MRAGTLSATHCGKHLIIMGIVQAPVCRPKSPCFVSVLVSDPLRSACRETRLPSVKSIAQAPQ